MTMSSARVALKQLDTTAGGWTAIASTPATDRDNEVVDAYAFEPLPASVPVHADHNLTVAGLVGRAKPYYDTLGVLHVDGKFADTRAAQQTRSLIVDGFIDAMSVAFATKDATVGSDGLRHITRAELYSVDFVSVPSNRDARVLSVRSVRPRLDAGSMEWALQEERAEMRARLRYLENLRLLHFGTD